MDKRVAIDRVSFDLNGRAVDLRPEAGERLSTALRERAGARDVKVGCDAGDCGACTVLLDGAAVCACMIPAHRADGRRVETLRGLHESDPVAARLAESFAAHGAAQCGICTPGMMVAATALLREDPEPSEEAVRDALGGVLCRCTGYRKIVAAVMRSGAPEPEGDGHVGAPIRRLDGGPKIDGTEVFGDDHGPPEALALHVIRSPHHRAGFTLGDVEGWAARTPGIEAVLTARDVPGPNRFGVIPGFEDQPVFAEDETRFRGEAVACVVGTSGAIARLDEASFPVIWKKRAPVRDVDEAAEGAQLHADRANNVMCSGFVKHGDPDVALAGAHTTVTASFRSPFVEHAYIEPEAGFAEVVGGRLHIHACTQAPVMDLETLGTVLAMDRRDIRIVPTAAGGGFGSKLDLSVQPFLALAALKTGKPVRIAYSRGESMRSTTKRHPSRITATIGADARGTITGMRFEGRFDTGAYASWGPTVANRVPVHASGPYRVPNYRAEATGIHTNGPPSGAFRGFGVPQAAIAGESLLDMLAEKLGLDPLELRIRNALRNGIPTVCGQVFEQGVGIAACLEALRPSWAEERARAARDGPMRRGVGVAAGWYGCGNTSLPNPSAIKGGITPDGRIVLHQGATDIGQGANTVIAQIFATALGVPVRQVEIVGPDTDVTPDAGKTSASRQTFVSGNAARLAGEALRAKVIGLTNLSEDAVLTVSGRGIELFDGEARATVDLAAMDPDENGFALMAMESYDPPTLPLDENGQGSPYAQFGYAAHLAVVEVDVAMGTTKVIRMVAAHDVGLAINPLLIEGQVEGGIAQGLGMALMEEYLPGRTENLHDYLIPTVGDVPPVETILIEEPDAHGPYGAKGLGEHVLIPTAPAILNAIAHATGVRMTEVPVTPARLRAALRGG